MQACFFSFSRLCYEIPSGGNQAKNAGAAAAAAADAAWKCEERLFSLAETVKRRVLVGHRGQANDAIAPTHQSRDPLADHGLTQPAFVSPICAFSSLPGLRPYSITLVLATAGWIYGRAESAPSQPHPPNQMSRHLPGY